MSSNPQWFFNENKAVGVDYFDKNLVANYDKVHGNFRDFDKEAGKLIEDLKLSSDSIILDIGCGPGNISVPLGRKCKHVYSVDISQAMVDILKNKINEQSIQNITAIQSGFLSYEHKGEELDAVICSVTLHHLPDFWKQVALCRLHDMLKPNGKLLIADIVFGFQPQNYQAEIDKWLSSMNSLTGSNIVHESTIHIRDEYSTWDWILTGMLERAKFSIDKKYEIMPQMMVYICSQNI